MNYNFYDVILCFLKKTPQNYLLNTSKLFIEFVIILLRILR